MYLYMATFVKKSYDICNDDSVDSVDGDFPQVSYDEYPASDIENSIPSYENPINSSTQAAFLQKIKNELAQTLTTSPLTPKGDEFQGFTDSLPQALCSPSAKSEAMRSGVSYEHVKCSEGDAERTRGNSGERSIACASEFEHNTRIALETMFIESNSPISSDHSGSDSDELEFDNMHFQEFAKYSARVAETDAKKIQGNSIARSNAGTATDLRECSTACAPEFQLLHEQVDNVFAHTKMNYKKITYEEIEKSLSKYYDKNNKYSNEMDILITFMRGQKHIYKESANVVQKKQYAITFTSLTITSLITVITPFIRVYAWSIILISGGNAIATVLMTALNYLRLDSSRNTFSLLSNHYEHFEHILELTNNKLLFINNESQQSAIVLDKIREIEFKMGETRELCPVIVPDEVKHTFPVICQTNIFSLIKKLELYRKQRIIQFKDIKNEIRYILYKWNAGKSNDNDMPQRQREKTRLLFLMEVKERIKKELIEYKNVYNQIDDLFAKEIKYAELNRSWGRFYTRKLSYETYTNPVIKDHLDLIFTQ